MVDAPIFKPGERCGPYTIQRLLDQGVPESYLAVPSPTAKNKNINSKSKGQSAANTPETPVFLQCADIRRTGDVTPTEEQWNATLAKLFALKHPLIPKLLSAGIHEHHIRWTASEHIRGTPFNGFGTSPRGPILGEILAFGLIVARIMSAAEAAGVMHGNLNLLTLVVTDRDEGKNASVHVVGLGSAELFGAPPDIPRKNPLLRPPEQLLGQAVGQAIDARTDIYSLGMILYIFIARAMPFGDGSGNPPTDFLDLAINQMPRRLSEVAGCSEFLSDVIDCAVQKEPEHRFPNWREFGSVLSIAFRQVRADAASRSKDEKYKMERDQTQNADAHYADMHPALEGMQSGFRERSPADNVAQEEDNPCVIEDSASSPPSTQKSGAEPPKLYSSPSVAPTLPAPKWSDPQVRRGLTYLLGLLLTSAGLGVFAGVALATCSPNARVEFANTSLVCAALLSLGVPEAASGLPNSPVVPPATQGTALSAQPSERSKPSRAPRVASEKANVKFPMDQWESSRRTLVRTAPPIVNK